jgi:hypothetical protein
MPSKQVLLWALFFSALKDGQVLQDLFLYNADPSNHLPQTAATTTTPMTTATTTMTTTTTTKTTAAAAAASALKSFMDSMKTLLW